MALVEYLSWWINDGLVKVRAICWSVDEKSYASWTVDRPFVECKTISVI